MTAPRVTGQFSLAGARPMAGVADWRITPANCRGQFLGLWKVPPTKHSAPLACLKERQIDSKHQATENVLAAVSLPTTGRT